MACSFNITFNSSPDGFVASVKKQVEDAGCFNGDSSSGNFSVPIPESNIVGSYTITRQQADIAVTHKPLLINCQEIEDYVESHMA
jgi:hypothetical protein